MSSFETSPFSGPKKESSPSPELSPAERLDQKILETLLIAHITRLNEGNNGVVFKIDEDRMPPEARLFLQKMGVLGNESTDPRVMKLLKLGRPGKLEHEYEMQRRAYEHIRPLASTQPDSYADIAEPFYFKRFEVSPLCKSILEDKHEVKMENASLEMLVMEQIPGVDLDTLLLQAFLKRHPGSKLANQPERLSSLSYTELSEQVALTLGMTLPWETPRRLWSIEDDAKQAQGRKQMISYLQQQGFQLDGRVLDKVEQTATSLYHDADIVWGDANLRNIMVEGEIDLQKTTRGAAATKTWAIDFGSAVGKQDGSPTHSIKEVLYAIEKLRAAFVAPERTPDTGIQLADRKRFTEPPRAQQAAFDQMVGILEMHLAHAPVIPFESLSLRYSRDPNWLDKMLPALFQLSQRSPEEKSHVLETVKAWSKHPALKQNIRATNNLARFVQLLNE